MKVNQSFNAGATKKLSKTSELENAINSNFTNKNVQITQSAQENSLKSEKTENLKNQNFSGTISTSSSNLTQTSENSTNFAKITTSENAAKLISAKSANLTLEKTENLPLKNSELSETENQKKVSKKNLSREKSDTFPVYLAQGERAPYKAFCAIQNISMNHFVVCAMDYFKQEIENGKVEITKHGYKRR